VLRLLTAKARMVCMRWQQSRRARVTYVCLRGLDEHTLRDLGLTPGELMSVAAELAGTAAVSRVQCAIPLQSKASADSSE